MYICTIKSLICYYISKLQGPSLPERGENQSDIDTLISNLINAHAKDQGYCATSNTPQVMPSITAPLSTPITTTCSSAHLPVTSTIPPVSTLLTSPSTGPPSPSKASSPVSLPISTTPSTGFLLPHEKSPHSKLPNNSSTTAGPDFSDPTLVQSIGGQVTPPPTAVALRVTLPSIALITNPPMVSGPITHAPLSTPSTLDSLPAAPANVSPSLPPLSSLPIYTSPTLADSFQSSLPQPPLPLIVPSTAQVTGRKRKQENQEGHPDLGKKK